MKFHFVSFILCLLAYLPVKAQDKLITIGNGGGFIGTVTVFKISSSGQVLRGKGISEINYNEQGKIKSRKARRFIKAVIKQTASIDFNHPGNLYYFMASNDHKLTWGDNAFQTPQEVSKLYQEILSTLNSIQYTKVP